MENQITKEYKVGEFVVLSFDKKEYKVSKVNTDGTIRLKCEDKSHPHYSSGEIGCYFPRNLETKVSNEKA